MNITINSERITAEEYIDFLKKTDLGSQYPKENFDRRIEKLVKNASVSLVARNEHNEIVGVCFGITDFAYWLFITDLGVIRSCTGKGIGRQLIFKALEAAGGEDEIVMYTCANEDAVPFYEKIGMKKSEDIMEYNRMPWTAFTVE
ncbi:MAG: GNAT family N-acetyltransferase [Oscillospiraceae bacterium]|nr:GNAT family N-acetyltransferase [Oscillospiraceae bacterium]